MNKNKKRSVIVCSLLSIAGAASIITGSTYALFTSSSSANIAVSSGTVSMTATMSDLSIYSPKSISTAEGNSILDSDNVASGSNFVNGGSATLTGNTLKLDKMTPGDKASFKITVKNESNVTIKYRTKIEVTNDTGLFAGLKVDIDELENCFWTDWQTLEPSSEEKTFDCSVELPTTAGNEYQHKNCEIAYIVEAVQGNAKVQDPAYVGSLSEVNTAIDAGVSEIVVNSFTADVDWTKENDRAALHFNNKKHPNMANTITINGYGTVEAVNNGFAIWAHWGANVIVNGGTYITHGGADDKVQTIYANNDSIITINGGTFISTGGANAEIFNVGDGDKGGTIIIKGGLYNKEPCSPTGWQTQDDYNDVRNTGIKIADGYTYVEEVINGETWYRVVKSSSD